MLLYASLAMRKTFGAIFAGGAPGRDPSYLRCPLSPLPGDVELLKIQNGIRF
jgi:hypothetical protein